MQSLRTISIALAGPQVVSKTNRLPIVVRRYSSPQTGRHWAPFGSSLVRGCHHTCSEESSLADPLEFGFGSDFGRLLRHSQRLLPVHLFGMGINSHLTSEDVRTSSERLVQWQAAHQQSLTKPDLVFSAKLNMNLTVCSCDSAPTSLLWNPSKWVSLHLVKKQVDQHLMLVKRHGLRHIVGHPPAPQVHYAPPSQWKLMHACP